MASLIKSISSQIQVRMRQKFGFTNDFFSAAADRHEICASEIIEGPPTKVLPGQFDRVTAAAFGGSVEREIATLQGQPRKTSPTNIYRFKNVNILQSWVIANGHYEIFGWPNSEWSNKPSHEIKTAALTSSFQGNRYFGHWLRDDCASRLLYSDSDIRIAIPRPDWVDATAYERAFSLPPSTIVQNVHVDEMFYCNDLIQNSHKAGRFKQLRERLRKTIDPIAAHDIVYIGRGTSAKARTFHNEQELTDALEQHGVKIVFAETLTSEEFIASIMDARIIISVEGSQLSHALYALGTTNPGMIVIQPPDRLFTSHLDWARVMNVQFGTVVGIKDGDGFTVPPEDVLRTIDLF